MHFSFLLAVPHTIFPQMFSVAVDCVSQDKLCCASEEHGCEVPGSVLLPEAFIVHSEPRSPDAPDTTAFATERISL